MIDIFDDQYDDFHFETDNQVFPKLIEQEDDNEPILKTRERIFSFHHVDKKQQSNQHSSELTIECLSPDVTHNSDSNQILNDLNNPASGDLVLWEMSNCYNDENKRDNLDITKIDLQPKIKYFKTCKCNNFDFGEENTTTNHSTKKNSCSSSKMENSRKRKKSGIADMLTEENYTENFDYKAYINQELDKIGIFIQFITKYKILKK